MTDKGIHAFGAAAALAGLKDFQRRTVDYVFRRMWLDEPAATRFLVADEVGLGKTLVLGLTSLGRSTNFRQG